MENTKKVLNIKNRLNILIQPKFNEIRCKLLKIRKRKKLVF